MARDATLLCISELVLERGILVNRIDVILIFNNKQLIIISIFKNWRYNLGIVRDPFLI